MYEKGARYVLITATRKYSATNDGNMNRAPSALSREITGMAARDPTRRALDFVYATSIAAIPPDVQRTSIASPTSLGPRIE